MDKLGKYDIVDKIGVGGFGVVFKGYDPFIKRHVAIKTCSAEDRETRERFLREAEIAGNLQHRNIVTVFEFGFQDETPYLVQEFLTGEDLDHKIKRRDAIPIADKLLWLIEVARGLEFAHQRGVVHRDIKPGNIRIQHDNNAKILDFGIAKLARHQSNLTQAGVTLGTASYLAPEQIRGERVDGRTDVFAFGVLAYELLTYERPFRAQEISALFYKLLNEKPAAISSKVAGVPPELERIVMCCLEKEPDRRFSPTVELVRALERLERQPGFGMPEAPSPDEATMVHEGATLAFPATRVLPTPAAQPARPPAAEVALGDFELDTPKTGARAGAAAPPVVGVRRSRRLPVILAGGAAVLAIAAAAILLGRPDSPPPTGESTRAETASPAQAPATGNPDPSPAATQPTGTDPAPPSGDPAPALPSPKPAVPAPEAAAPAPAPSQPAPVAEAPRRGRLVVGPGWDPGMTVTIDGRRYRLDQERTIELAAGTYALAFALETPAYVFERDLRLKLSPGATERVAIPIERPGRLTVQPHLNTRGGTVRIDGSIAGPAPLRGRWLAPGEHFVEIFPLGGAEPAFTRSIAIASGAESILTFDLDGKLEPTLRERPLPAP